MVHPSIPIVLAILAVAICWSLRHFFGISSKLIDLVVGAFVIYGALAVIMLATAGLFSGARRWLGNRK